MIFCYPSQDDVPPARADLLIVDRSAPSGCDAYVANLGQRVVFFAQYTGEVKRSFAGFTNLQMVVVQGHAKHSRTQQDPSPGHSRELVYWLRHLKHFNGVIVVVSNLVRELNADYLLSVCGADHVVPKSQFKAAPDRYFRSA